MGDTIEKQKGSFSGNPCFLAHHMAFQPRHLGHSGILPLFFGLSPLVVA